MKLSELKLGYRVYVAINRDIREGYIVGIKSSPTRLLTHLKLPKFRLAYQFLYQTIQQVLTDRDVRVLKYVNIKPIFLLLMKRFMNVSLQDLAAFFSIYVKVAVKTSSGGTEIIDVVASRVYATRAEAAERNKETGRYCYICGKEYKRGDNIPKNPIAPCSKCSKSIERTIKIITDLLPFNLPIIPPNGIKVSGAVMEGKIFYPYKSEIDMQKYKELIDNPDWKLEDVTMRDGNIIEGAVFSTRKLLKLVTNYKKKDYRHPYLKNILLDYQKYLLTGMYKKPIIRNRSEYLSVVDDSDIERVFSTDNTPPPYTVFLEDNLSHSHNIERMVYINQESFEQSLLTIDKADRTYYRLGLNLNENTEFDRVTCKVYLERVGFVRELIAVKPLNNSRKTYVLLLPTKDLPSGLVGIYIETASATDTFTSTRIDKFYFKVKDSLLDPTTIPNKFRLSNPNFLQLLNDRIFYYKLPLKDILVEYLPVSDSDAAKISIKLNGTLIQELIFDKSLEYPPTMYTEAMGISTENRWKYQNLSDIHYETIKNYISEDTFGINKLDFEFWDNDNKISHQRIFFRITGNSATFVDGIESVMSKFTSYKDYSSSIYEIRSDIVISHLKRPFTLRYLILDYYKEYPTNRTDKAPLYRSIVEVNKPSSVYNHLHNIHTVIDRISVPIRSSDHRGGRIPEGAYFITATALVQYAEDMEKGILKSTLNLTELGHPIGIWKDVSIISTKFNLPEQEPKEVLELTLDNDDPYTNAVNDGNTIVNLVINKKQLTYIMDKIAFITGRRSTDEDRDARMFAESLSRAINKTKGHPISSAKLTTAPPNVVTLIKVYDKYNWFAESVIVQMVFSPTLTDLTLVEALEDQDMLSDIRDNLNTAPGYRNFSIEYMDPPIDTGDNIAIAFLRVVGVNLSSTRFDIGNKVFFTKRVGSEMSPVHTVHSGILEEISLRMPATLPPFRNIESTIYSAMDSVEAGVLSSMIPKFGVNNPPDLPMDLMKTYRVGYDHLFSRYDDAKNSALWIFCLFCGRFKPSVPKDLTFKEAAEFTEFLLTSEVDNEKSKIPEQFRNLSNLNAYALDIAKKVTFNSKLKEAYRGINKENLMIALKVNKEGSVQLSNNDYNRYQKSMAQEEEYLKNLNKNLFTSDYDLNKAGLSRDPFANNMSNWPSKEMENLALEPRQSILDKSSPSIANVFPDSSARVDFLMRQLGYEIDQIPKRLVGGITPLNNLIEKIQYSQRINNAKLDELRSKLNFGIIDLGSLIGDELASHVGFCSECQRKIENEVVDVLRKVSNYLLGFPIDATKEVKFYTIDYIDVEFYNETTDYTKYDFVLPLNSMSNEDLYIRTEISRQLEKL